MRERIWYELAQAKHNNLYCCFLISHLRSIINAFNIIILSFSTSGVMGWPFWKEIPFIACAIIAVISLLRLLQPHLIPTEKQVDKINQVADFYFEYYNELEGLWFDYNNGRVNDIEAQKRFYEIKKQEKPINQLVNEIIRGQNKKIVIKTENASKDYLERTFNAK
jgi:hypothetical protein